MAVSVTHGGAEEESNSTAVCILKRVLKTTVTAGAPRHHSGHSTALLTGKIEIQVEILNPWRYTAWLSL